MLLQRGSHDSANVVRVDGKFRNGSVVVENFHLDAPLAKRVEQAAGVVLGMCWMMLDGLEDDWLMILSCCIILNSIPYT